MKKCEKFIKDKNFMIAGWDTPIHSDESYRLIKEGNFTHMFFDSTYILRDSKEFKEALDTFDKYNIGMILQLGNHSNKLDGRVSGFDDYNALSMINYCDEPLQPDFSALSEMVDEHNKVYGDKKIFFVNLFPRFDDLIPDYKTYVNEFCKCIIEKLPEGKRFISCDIYPLRGGTVNPYWLNNLETLAKACKKYNADLHMFIQSLRIDELYMRDVDEKDFRFQFYVNMAYGAKGISYFTYRDSNVAGFCPALVDKLTGLPHEKFFCAARVNGEIKALEKDFLSCKWVGSAIYKGTAPHFSFATTFEMLEDALQEADGIESLSSVQDALLGCFKKGNGNAYILVNYSDPIDNVENTITIKFSNAKKLLIYRKGVAYFQEINCEFEITLDSGEGIFIIEKK